MRNLKKYLSCLTMLLCFFSTVSSHADPRFFYSFQQGSVVIKDLPAENWDQAANQLCQQAGKALDYARTVSFQGASHVVYYWPNTKDVKGYRGNGPSGPWWAVYCVGGLTLVATMIPSVDACDAQMPRANRLETDRYQCQMPTKTSCAAPSTASPYGVGNPCDPSTGFKYQTETDISGVMSLQRSFNSGYLANVGFGKGWRSRYHKSLQFYGDSVSIIEGSGRGELWSRSASIWEGDADSDYTLTEQPDGRFVLSLNRGGSETYDSEGRLSFTTDAKGNQTTYTYTNGNLSQVTNHYGKGIEFSYNHNNISSVKDALGNVYHYQYDVNDNLVAVIYPDATPSDSDNPRRVYHYENIDFPNYLTGITDENGDRYSTYSYDEDGKATSTEYAQTINGVPQERFQLNYQD